MRSHHLFDPQRQINAITSVRQDKDSSHRVHRYGTFGPKSMNGVNTNNYTGLARRNWILLQTTNCMADVFGLKSVGGKTASEGVHIRTCGTAYECPRNQKTYILFHNEMLFFVDELDHTLLNPNQMCNYGIPFWDNPFEIYRVLVIEISDGLDITLIMKGKKIGIMI